MNKTKSTKFNHNLHQQTRATIHVQSEQQQVFEDNYENPSIQLSPSNVQTIPLPQSSTLLPTYTIPFPSPLPSPIAPRYQVLSPPPPVLPLPEIFDVRDLFEQLTGQKREIILDYPPPPPPPPRCKNTNEV